MREVVGTVKERLLALKKKSGSSSSSGEQHIVALDIGTENVKALIGRIDDEGVVEVIGSGRAHQGLSDMQAGAVSDIVAVTANCNKALADAEKEAGVSPRAVVIGIAGELVKGTTISVRVTRKDSQKPMEVEEIDRMIGAIQDKAFEKARKQITEELGGKDIDIRLVNSALVRMEIDGYPVTNPVGFQGKEVVVQLYTAFAPLIHIGALEQVAQQLDMDLLAVVAEPFAVFRSIVGDDDSSMSAILMDIGGGTTDIAVVDEGGVQGTSMFGIGGRAFTRSIERDMDITYDKAESMKLACSKGALSGDTKKDVERALLRTIDTWQSGIEIALEEFTKLDNLPHTMLLCGGGSSLELLVEELKRSDWHKNLPFAKKPTIKHIAPNTVVDVIDVTDNITDHTMITAMGLLRVGVDTIGQTGDDLGSGSIRSRINRLLRI